jgi:hypothetical protein
MQHDENPWVSSLSIRDKNPNLLVAFYPEYTRAPLESGFFRPTMVRTQEGIVMSGWRPLIKGYFGVALVVGAVMSSALFGGE